MCIYDMSLLLLIFFFFVNGGSIASSVSPQINHGEVKNVSIIAESSASQFRTECGRQFYQPTTLNSSTSGVSNTSAKENAWPWAIMLFRKGELICGGTLIDTRHVLTAASCIPEYSQSNVYQARVSMNYMIKSIYNEQTILIQFLRVHEKYLTNDGPNDIAILRLAQPIRISEEINVICLPGPEANKEHEEVWGVGWDEKSSEGRTSQYLIQIPLQMIWGCQYSQRYNFDNKTQMCAVGREPEQYICQKDSGGPLMYEINGIWYLNGISSYSQSCGGSDPILYTRVSYHLSWIQSKLKIT